MSEHTAENDARHCHADGAGPCLADDCPITGLGTLRGFLRACPGAPGAQHPGRVTHGLRRLDGGA